MKMRFWIVLGIFSIIIATCGGESTPERYVGNIWVDTPLNDEIIPMEPYRIVFHGVVLKGNFEVSVNGVVDGLVPPMVKIDPDKPDSLSYSEYFWMPPAPGEYLISIRVDADNWVGTPGEVRVIVTTNKIISDDQPIPDLPISTPEQVILTPPTETPAPVTSPDCDIASFIEDVTVPDGTVFNYGEAFTKTWRLKNIGTCPWTRAYELVFFSGESMSGPESQAFVLAADIEPNQTVNISVDLIAPRVDGEYTGYWKLKNSDGDSFGLSNGDPFYVEIEVAKSNIGIESPVTDPGITLLTPDFSIEFAGLWTCTYPKVSFRIENTGNVSFESLYDELEGPPGTLLNSGTAHYPFRDPPPPASDCQLEGNQYLEPGEVAWFYTGYSTLSRGVTTGRLIINICSNADLGGLCIEKTLDFDWSD